MEGYKVCLAEEGVQCGYLFGGSQGLKVSKLWVRLYERDTMMGKTS
jgi:hypothetical protein